MNSRAMQIEFERRITLMNPNFELAEKLTSDTIFSFLNAYTERYVRLNYLQEDAVQDGTRAQKKNADALKGLITRGLYAVEAKDEIIQIRLAIEYLYLLITSYIYVLIV